HSPERVAAFEEKVRNRHEAAVLDRWRTELRPALLARLKRLQAADRAALSDDELLDHVAELRACEAEALAIHFTDASAASVYVGRLGLFCAAELDLSPNEVLQLVAGFSTATREPAA